MPIFFWSSLERRASEDSRLVAHSDGRSIQTFKVYIPSGSEQGYF
jgi:hypothetical protein